MKGEVFLNKFVLSYLFIVFGGQALYYLWHRLKRHMVQGARRAQGLTDEIFLSHAEKLSDRKREALIESGILLVSIVITPFILYYYADDFEKKGLAITFIGLIVWVVYSGTDVAKAFLGGLAFKTLAAFTTPFQVGDRVNLKGASGKVTDFNTFLIKIQTADDDAISIPTHALWGETLTSVNAGTRASKCVMNFYLAPFTDRKQRQKAEDTIWDAIQASAYFDPTKPMQIFLSQKEESIQLTAKAYVASTYDEPLFCSDVTRAFLDFATKEKIPLASSQQKIHVESHPMIGS